MRALLIALLIAGCGAKPGSPLPDDAGLPGAADTGLATDAERDRSEPRDMGSDSAARDGALDGRDAPAAIDAAPAAIDAAALRCNGFEQLCDRRFDQVVFPASHNAMSNSDDGWIAPDQVHGIARALEDGIRALLIDTYSWRGGSYLCHMFCEIGNKPLVDGLKDIAKFMRENPAEVITLIIEDHLPAADTETAFKDSGLVDLVYVHDASGPWPTLRTMIATNKRVFVGAEQGRPPPAWYHHFYDLAWDTPYTFRSKDDFTCKLLRGKPENALFLLNHWIENPLPSSALSTTANAHDVLLGRARQCMTESGRLPNFVAVNHYSIGDLFAVVRELNGL
jgi:hypothetical protein